jgi:hypothetical protein
MNSSEIERRQFFADRLAEYFRQHPLTWISIMDLIRIGGPSWRSRIACDLRPEKKRNMNIVWNKSNKESAYLYTPWKPLGRSAETVAPALPLFDRDGPWQR